MGRRCGMYGGEEIYVKKLARKSVRKRKPERPGS
jgi:hypothetical protein